MARAGKTAQEFIQNSFSPLVAVLCSPKVDNVVGKNNLSFIELLQPFATIDTDEQFREPGGSLCTVKSWKLVLRDVNWKPLQPPEARRQLNNAVLLNYNDKTLSLEIGGKKIDIPQSTAWFDAWRETYLEVQFPSDHEFTKHFLSCIIVGTTYDENIIDAFNSLNQQYAQLQNVTPPKLPKWFNNGVLKSYLLLHDASAMTKDMADTIFETVKQTFGSANCFMLSINSKNNKDSNTVGDFWAQYIKQAPEANSEISSSLTNLPTTPLEAHTLPTSSSIAISEDNNLTVTSTNQETSHPLTATENDFYDNANSLQTHSFSGSSENLNVAGKPVDYSSVEHGSALNASDVEAIKKFVNDYATKALLPYLEKQIAQLSEVVANRKGVSRSLLSATKRWFGTGKAGNTTGNNTVIYSNDCPELQLRRLGDLWFLCGQWQRAFDTYHTAKREFSADSAWLCYAGALEMAAISAFMAGDANRKTNGYMEESILTYLNTCRMVQYAVRATLLSVLCLSGTGLHGEAAKQLIRMTSEDSDLRSAMLLEQASLCFLAGPGSKAMCRKYAFHMVLAGHRFSKAGQKKHAYRCYKQAFQVYAESGWRLSTDHVQFALGRLAGALRMPRDAVRWLAAPLAPAAGTQPPHQQDAFLREYILAHQQWIEGCDEYKGRLPELPLPLLVRAATAVLCVGPAPLSSPGRTPATSLALPDAAEDFKEDERYWHKLEEMLLQVAQGSVPMIFKPTVDLYTESTDSNPVVPQGEPIQISVTLQNPLKISLLLKDVELLWQFTPNPEDTEKEFEVINNETLLTAGSNVENNVIVGQKIKSALLDGECDKILTFLITPLRVGQLNIYGLAYKLINAGEDGKESGNGTMIFGKVNLSSNNSEKRLQIQVIPEAPCLQMTFTETCKDALSNELRTIDMELRNVGPVDMRNVHIAVSHPDCVTLVTEDGGDDFKALYDEKYRELPPSTDERAARAAAWRAAAAWHGWRVCGAVGRGACGRARLRLRPRARLHLLAYYETGHRARPYRLLRHVFRFDVSESVDVSITPRRSLKNIDGETLENMILAVELKNVCGGQDQDVNVEVLEASLLSRQWRLTEMTPVAKKVDLAAHERLHLIFKARRIFETLAEGKVEHTCLKLDPEYSEADNDLAPYYKYIYDFKPSYMDSLDSASHDKPTKSQGLIQSMFVIRWRAHNKSNGRSAIGQNCMWIDCFTKTVSRNTESIPLEVTTIPLDDNDAKPDLLDTKQKIKKDNVVFRLEHTNVIQHNFNQRRLCLIPITINLVNCYEVPVKVFIDMSKQQNRESFGELGWAGALNHGPDIEDKKVGVSVILARFESRRVLVRALCAAPGSYLVGAAFNVTSTRDNHPPVTHAADDTSLLVVQQAAG